MRLFNFTQTNAWPVPQIWHSDANGRRISTSFDTRLGPGNYCKIGAFLGDLRATSMAIYRLIAKGSFEPEEIEVMTAAYEAALSDLSLVDRDDPLTEIVARAILNITSRGERDPATIKIRALNTIGVGKSDAA